MRLKILISKILILAAFFIVGANFSYASETVGTVNTSSKYAWGDKIGWINFAPVNSSGSYVGITITDTAITGYAWSKEFGWINFSPSNSGQGVTNTDEGVLGG